MHVHTYDIPHPGGIQGGGRLRVSLEGTRALIASLKARKTRVSE